MERMRPGIRENLPQFALLVLVNAFVGAMIGMERSLLPTVAAVDFHLHAQTAVLSFILIFGIVKALTNYLAGHYSDRFGRKQVLVAGWCLAVPVPVLLAFSTTWRGILVANALLGASQGLTWSTTVIMKIDLSGPKRRGLAMGINEFAGYFAVAGSAFLSGTLAARFGLRPVPFYPGFAYVVFGMLLSVFAVRETKSFADAEAKARTLVAKDPNALTPIAIFLKTSFGDRNLASISQAGLVNNLNDGMAWGLFPLLFASSNQSLPQVATLTAIYPATWGLSQLATGPLSDRLGRKSLLVSGMWLQALAILVVGFSKMFQGFAGGSALLGLGTALVYPTLLAAIGDVAAPAWRASAVGVYRLWRDLGYAIGAVVAGVVADRFGLHGTWVAIAAITFASGVVVAVRMRLPAGPR